MQQSTSIRLSPHAKLLLKAVADKLGVSQGAVMEMAVRKMAAQENVTVKMAKATVEE